MDRSLIPIGISIVMLGFLGPGVSAQPQKNLQISVGETPQLVFDWNRDRCDKADIPDTPLRAFKRDDGEIVAFSSHYVVRAEVGKGLASLVHRCSIVFKSNENPDPSQFNDRIWISAIWSTDGKHVFALGHQEFQAQRHKGRCAFTEYGKCWYNTVNLLGSSDGGETFALRQPVIPVAAPNLRSEDDQGRPRGFFEPSNLIEFGGHIYTMINTTGGRDQQQGVCLFRTPLQGSGDEWSYLTQDGWVSSRHDPYRSASIAPCSPIKGLFGPVHSVVRHRSTGLFIALMTIPGGPRKGDLAFSTSTDLLTWSKPTPFLAITTIFSGRCEPAVYAYPALLDAEAEGRNFDDVGERAYLFMVRNNRRGCAGSYDRDLVRFPVEIKVR